MLNEFDNKQNFFINAVEISKYICKLKLKDGDIAVDCTMGNGNDTAFLCDLVGDEGKVYAFDIQETAIINTKDKLKELNLIERAEIIFDSHQNIDKYIKENVKLIMFNLGYLPGGNHDITTEKNTTIKAAEKCLSLIEPSGIIIFVVYSGHANGREEKRALECFTSELNQKEYNVVKICFTNQINNPPELICIEKVYK